MRQRRRRSTPPGQHRPVLLDEVMAILDPQPGQIVVDATVGWGGHAVSLLERIGPSGMLIGLDLDAENLSKARERLAPLGFPFHLRHANFAGLDAVLAELGIGAVDLLLADLGMSSMQLDDPGRGFSYARDGPLDMRMDPSRGKTAAQLLATIAEAELAGALRELGDEPNAERIARAIISHRDKEAILGTSQLASLIQQASGQPDWSLHPRPSRWNLHPAARTFQTLRILVNRELGNLGSLLRIIPTILKPKGGAALISFHSGEDRLVKAAFRAGIRSGVYDRASEDAMRPNFREIQLNPRARSAKLRSAMKC